MIKRADEMNTKDVSNAELSKRIIEANPWIKKLDVYKQGRWSFRYKPPPHSPKLAPTVYPKRIKLKKIRGPHLPDTKILSSKYVTRTAPYGTPTRYLITFYQRYKLFGGGFGEQTIKEEKLEEQYSKYAQRHYGQYWLQEQEGVKNFYGISAYRKSLKLVAGCKPLEDIDPTIGIEEIIKLFLRRLGEPPEPEESGELSAEYKEHEIAEMEVEESAEETPEELGGRKKKPEDYVDDCRQEAWFAYLHLKKEGLSGEQLTKRIKKYLNDWWFDNCIRSSDPLLSVNWLPEAPRKDGRVGYTVRSKDGHIADMGDTQGGRWYDRRSLKMWENDDRYEVEYQFDNGWPGTGGPKEGGIYLYRRPYTDNMKACAYRVGYSVCDPLAQDMQGKPEYYMAGDVCWECYLARGIDPIRLSVAWLWLLDAAVSGRLITQKQGMTFYLYLTDYYSREQHQIAVALGTKRSTITRRLQRIFINLQKNYKKDAKNVTSALYIDRGERIKAAIKRYEEAHQWHKPPKHRILTETLSKEALTGDKDALNQLEQQCRPAGWPPSSSWLTDWQDVERWGRVEVGSGDAFGEGEPLYSMTGESGLNLRIGSHLVEIRACPKCNGLVKGANPKRCETCGAKLHQCKNKVCGNFKTGKQLLSADKCPRCSTKSIKPDKKIYCREWASHCDIYFTNS